MEDHIVRAMAMGVRYAAVLAGGRSSRMGVDKAMVRVGGVMMLERVVRAAMGAGLEVMVVGRGAAVEGWPAELRVKWLEDEGAAFAGPAAGLVRALEEVGESVVLLGCDLPLVSSAGIRALVTAHEAGGRAATLAVREFAEPAFAVYSAGMLERARMILRGEQRGFQWLVGEADVLAWRVPAEFSDELLNVNDAESFAIAEKRISGGG
jgi:molybdopterin-guanine dinucleotide biosynthesis protein A